MKASDLLVRCLENEGVDHVFGVPGEEVLDLIRVEEVRAEMKRLVGHKLEAGQKARSAR